jgi:hypothetical protein
MTFERTDPPLAAGEGSMLVAIRVALTWAAGDPAYKKAP